MKEIYIDSAGAGGRLDKLVFRYLDGASAGFVYKMIRKKNITLNGKRAQGADILKEGDVVRFFLSDETIARFSCTPREKSASHVPELDVLFEDENICAALKPAGLLSQKAKPGDISANDFFIAHIKSGEAFKPGILNRLDRNTSGIVVSGKNYAAARELAAVIKERSAVKKYLCPAAGMVEKEERLEGWLVKDKEKNTVSVSDRQIPGAAKIITCIKPLSSNGRFTLLEVGLITGKSHQIRAHLKAAGHPIAGDTKYGDKKVNDYARQKYGLTHQLLHASQFGIEGAKGVLEYLNGTVIYAPLPAEFEKFLEGEGLWVPGAREA